MRRVLLIDRSRENAVTLKTVLHHHGFEVHIEDRRWLAVQELRQPVPLWEFVVVVAGASSETDLAFLRELIAASQQFQQSGLPEFVFATRSRCTPAVRMRIVRLGARYVRL